MYGHHLRLTFALSKSIYSIAQRRYLVNSKDYGVIAAEEYIVALIVTVSLFRIH